MIQNRNSLFDDDDLRRLERLMMQYKLAIRAQMIKSGHWTTGRTWQSIEPEVVATPNTLECRLQSPNNIVFDVLENGRGAGSVPFDFERMIYDWSISKGLNFKDDKARWDFAKAVKWKTYLYGNKTFRDGIMSKIYSNLEPAYQKKVMQFINTIAINKINGILDSFKP